jgi:hypothetical protein
MSSLSFLGDETSYLTVPNAPELNFGTGDFTIEWYQYQTDENDFPRIFQQGTYPGAIIGLSIESGSFNFWTNGSYEPISLSEFLDEYKNVWVHFAIVRSSGTVQYYINGTSVHSYSNTGNYANGPGYDLTIGNELVKEKPTAFGGYIKYLAWYKNYAKYTSNFIVTDEIPSAEGTSVLFTAAGFYGTLGSTVVNTNVETGDPTPPTPPTPTPTQTIRQNFGSLYTNNAQVFYKSNSLASGGVGTVRNSRSKARRT